MLGKNRGRTLRPRPNKIIELSGTEDSNEGSSSLGEHVGGSLVEESLSIIPRKVGSDLSFIQFADTIEESTVAVILQFSSIAKKALFPLESCINFGVKDMAWMEALTVDAAYLHAMVFSAQGYFDMLVGRIASCRPGSTRAADPQVVKTLGLLRERLEMSGQHAERMIKTSFSTATVVMCLAHHAHVLGEHQAARHHMQGLRKIVDLNGGLWGLRDNTKLLIEIFRLYIGMTLYDGSSPLFFADLIWEPYWPYPDFTPSSSVLVLFPFIPESYEFLNNLDPEIAQTWSVTKSFSALVNHAASTHTKLPKEYLFDTMTSVICRLLHKSNDFERGSLDETIRLGLLAFCSSVFLQWTGMRFPYAQFPAVYRDCLVNLQLPELDGNGGGGGGGDIAFSFLSQLLLWLLMVGAVSVFTEDDDTWLKPWLCVNIDLCEANGSWATMRDVLNSFMWVEMLHDGPGKVIFDSTSSSESYSK